VQLDANPALDNCTRGIV